MTAYDPHDWLTLFAAVAGAAALAGSLFVAVSPNGFCVTIYHAWILSIEMRR